jgi:hypothetical protein
MSEAAIAYWQNRSMRRACLCSMNFSTSKSFTSPAKFTFSLPVSKRVIRPMPDLPASRACQFFSVPVPSEVMRPVPVMTTRRGSTKALS